MSTIGEALAVRFAALQLPSALVDPRGASQARGDPMPTLSRRELLGGLPRRQRRDESVA